MSTPPSHLPSSSLTTPQKLIIQSSSPTSIPSTKYIQTLQQKIKQNLNIDRSSNQIQLYLQQSNLQKQNQQNLQIKSKQNINLTLFKTFQNDRKTQQQPLMHHKPKITNKIPLTFYSPRKIPKKQSNQHHSYLTLQQRLDQLEQINQQCTYTFDQYDRKTNRKTSNKQLNGINNSILWFYHQFFYSNYDRKYFDLHPMKDIYLTLELKPGQTTFKTHKTLLKSLPSPKLFNDQFINAQKTKLQDFRNTCRQTNTKNLPKTNQSTTDFPVQSSVLALHPMCGHLHPCVIMAYYKQNLYLVKFIKAQLATQKILDIHMSTQFIAPSSKPSTRPFQASQKNPNQSIFQQNLSYQIVQQINYEITAYLIKIFSFKCQIIKFMKTINDSISKQLSSKDLSINQDIFLWIVNIAEKLDLIVQQTLVRFRLRGVNQSNSSHIYGNLRSLLLSPLKLMSKQFENSNEQSDINAAQQIRQIINNQRENQIKRVLNNAITILNTTNNPNIKSQPQSQNIGKQNIKLQPNMMNFIYLCLGVLADLRFEGKGFDVYNNANLAKLGDMCEQQHNSQAFNQVYQKLFKIVNKVKQ